MPKVDLPFETLLADLHGADWLKRCTAARLLGQSRDPRAVAALLPDLQAKDWRVRRNAVQALGALKLPETLEPLLDALKDKTATVRQRAAVGLGRLKDARALPALLATLQHDQPVRPATYQALRKFGHQAGPAVLVAAQTQLTFELIQLLAETRPPGYLAVLLPHCTDPDASLRSASIAALGYTQDPTVIPSLLEQLPTSDPATQTLLVQALGQLGATVAVPQLLALLQGDDLFGPRAALHRAVTTALQQFSGVQAEIAATFPGPFPRLALGGTTSDLPEQIGRLGPTGFQQLNTLLAQMETRLKALGPTYHLPPEVVEKMVDHTWQMGSQLADAREARAARVAHLLERLHAAAPLTRAAAALSIIWYTDPQALAPLTQATADPDPTVQQVARWALAALRRALPPTDPTA